MYKKSLILLFTLLSFSFTSLNVNASSEPTETDIKMFFTNLATEGTTGECLLDITDKYIEDDYANFRTMNVLYNVYKGVSGMSESSLQSEVGSLSLSDTSSKKAIINGIGEMFESYIVNFDNNTKGKLIFSVISELFLCKAGKM